MPAGFDRNWLRSNLVWQRVIFLAIGFASWYGYPPSQIARAETEAVVINVPVYNQVVDRALMVRAESLVEGEIQRRFGQGSEISSLEITVLGDSNGEIAPILTAAVSREQWADNPTVGTWITYYDSTYQLFQRHEDVRDEIIAGIPVRATVARSDTAIGNQGASRSRKPSGQRLTPWQIDEAYDEGRLSGEVIQERYLDELD